MEGDVFKYYGLNLTLTQDAYASNDFTRQYETVDNHGYALLNPVCVFEASCIDEEGDKYTIIWDITNTYAEEDCDACNWDEYTVRKH